MRYLLLFLLCSVIGGQISLAQRQITFDPELDYLARRSDSDTLQLLAPFRITTYAIEQANPQISEIDQLQIRRIGKSSYLVASGKDAYREGNRLSLAILLAETTPGFFQADALVISCSSSGECRECALPPDCSCLRGQGSCAANSALRNAMKKVTLTLFD